METHKPLLKDVDGEDVDEHLYRSMIRSLMYLTSSRPDIMFVVCACVIFQVNPKSSHLHVVKRIFRYLKGQPKLGLWYPKDSPFDLVAYTDSDYAGASLDRKSTIGGCQFLGCRLILWQCKKQTVVANSTTKDEYIAASNCCRQFWDTVKAKTVNGEVQLQALVDKKKVIITKSTIRRDLQLEDANGVDCLPNAAIFEQLTLMGVLDLKTTKTAQAKEIASLKKRVKKMERKRKSKTQGMKRLFKIGRSAQVVSSEDEGLGDQEDASKQGRKIDDIDQDVEVTLVDETHGRYDDAQMHDTDVFNGEKVFVAEQSEKFVEKVVCIAEVSAATTINTKEITLAQALAELRSVKPKVVVQEPVQSITTTAPSTIPKAKSITFRDPEELAFKLQAKEEEQARLVREKAEKVKEANISWDNVQAMIQADRLLAERLQAREQEELIDEEKEKLFVELLEKRKKHFAALRAQEKRNKPPTKAQKKKIQKLFDKAMTRVNMFVDKDTELVKERSKKAKAEMAEESSSKRAGDELEQEPIKKQKVDDDKEEDLENLWKLVKAKHRNTRPEEGYERVLWEDLKTMFEHHIEDEVWRSLQGKKVLLWRLYDSCRIHFVRFEDMHVYMLVEKRYPLTPATITDMLNKKLKSNYWNKMC
ncbi:hypothetical protein Tco_1133748 [Tanacetum coccineum]